MTEQTWLRSCELIGGGADWAASLSGVFEVQRGGKEVLSAQDEANMLVACACFVVGLSIWNVSVVLCHALCFQPVWLPFVSP